MQPVQISAIALGNWNPKIFSPGWVKDHLLSVKDNEGIEVLLDFNDMDFSLQFKNLMISPKRTVLELQTKAFSKEDKELFTKCLTGIFNLLPQTPIKAIGINIMYLLKSGEEKKYQDRLKLAMAFKGFDVTMLRYSKKNERYVTNIIVEKETESTIKLNFNFHYSKMIDLDITFLDKHIEETQKLISNGI